MTGRIEPSSLRAYNFSHRWRGEARLGSIRTGSSLRLRFTGQCWPLANAGGDRRWGVRWTWPSSLTWSSKPQSAREAVHTWTSEFVKPVRVHTDCHESDWHMIWHRLLKKMVGDG